MNASLSRRGETAPLIALMPYIKTAKPSRMSPTWRVLCPLVNMRRMMPITAMIPVSVAVLSSCTQPLPPERSDRQMIQPVTLVPRIAPSTMPMA